MVYTQHRGSQCALPTLPLSLSLSLSLPLPPSLPPSLPLSPSLSLSDTASQLQGHVHWLLELAIKLVSNFSSGNTTCVRIIPANALALRDLFYQLYHSSLVSLSSLAPQLPESGALRLLRQALLLVYIWNKTLPQHIIPVTGLSYTLYSTLHLTHSLTHSPTHPFTLYLTPALPPSPTHPLRRCSLAAVQGSH